VKTEKKVLQIEDIDLSGCLSSLRRKQKDQLKYYKERYEAG